MRGLTDRVLLVAGAATGIGAASARRLAKEGAKVVVGDINIDAAAKNAQAIADAGGTALAVEYDQADEASVGQLVARTVEHFGALRGVHVNAADLGEKTLGRDVDLLEMDVAIWERTLLVNLIGYATIIRAAVPHLLSVGGGPIVCTSSDATVAAEPTRPAYACSKAGVQALVRHVASRWGKERIRCNAIAPGAIMTERAYEYLERQGDDFSEKFLASPRSFRVGQPEDIAGAVAFLLSDDGEWINGQVWSVNGGAALRD